MRRREAPKTFDPKREKIVQHSPKVFADDDYPVMGKEKFHPLQFPLVGKTPAIEARPGQSPFLRLPWGESRHDDQGVISVHAANDRRV